MSTAVKYYTRGTPDADGTEPAFAYQGLEAFSITFVDDIPVSAPMDNGEIALGYKAKEVTEAEFTKWKNRINGADQSGFVDNDGRWYPGKLGQGQSVINESAYISLSAYRYRRDMDKLSVSRAQALLALLDKYNVTKEMIYAGIDTNPEPERTRIRIWFDEARSFKRSNKDLIAVGSALGLNESALDELFVEAGKL